jgi:phosphate acetyltransferase
LFLLKGGIEMNFMENIWHKAQQNKKRIVLAEGEEERNLKACEIILKNSIADIILVGNESKIRENAERLGVNIDGAEIASPEHSDMTPKLTESFYELRKNKGMTLEKAEKIVKDPIYFATMLLKEGYADGLVSGAIHTTGDLLRPGLQILKTAPGVSIVSSFFVMILPDNQYGDNGLLLFTDCGVNINPTSEELANIAISTAETAKNLCGMDPKVAMLSFSTLGSASGEMVEKVQKATAIAKELRPDLDIDGELQLDAAIVPEVAKIKAPNSKVAGKANILVFPDLQAGNIGYKLVQRFAKADAIGPLCQGFAKPINDLSRGCNVKDIVDCVAITVVEAQSGI